MDIMELQQGPTLKVTPASSYEKSAQLAYRREELAQEIQSRFLVNESFQAKYESLWTALDSAFNDFFILKSKKHDGNQSKRFDAAALFHTAAYNMRVLSSDPVNGSDFSSRNGKIHVHDGKVQFIPDTIEKKGKETKKPLTYEDAFNVIMIMQANRLSLKPNTLVIEGGTRDERLMYARAVHAYNANVTPELQIQLQKGFKAPVWDISPINMAAKNFQSYMRRAVPLPDIAEENDKDEVEPAVIEVEKETPVAPTASPQIAYIQKKGSDIEAFLAKNEKDILKQPSVGKTGGFPVRNVYLVNIPGYANDETYVAKVGGKLTLIHTKDNTTEFRDEHIYRENDTAHEKHPQYRPPATQEIPTPSSVVDLSDFSMAATTFTQPYPNFDKFRETFWGAVTIQPAAPAPAPVQERASKPAGPKPGAGSVG